MENDVKRLKEFKELKGPIRANPDYLIVGVDAAKLRHHARFMLGSGRIVSKDFSFDNTLKGFEEFLGRIEMFKEKTDSLKVVCGLESTGNYERPLADFLCRNNLHVVMVSTLAVSKNRLMMDLSWDKNDPKDAINVADLVAQGKFLFYPFWEEQYQEAKRLIRLYHRMVKERARLPF
jgi:transposase